MHDKIIVIVHSSSLILRGTVDKVLALCTQHVSYSYGKIVNGYIRGSIESHFISYKAVQVRFLIGFVED